MHRSNAETDSNLNLMMIKIITQDQAPTSRQNRFVKPKTGFKNKTRRTELPNKKSSRTLKNNKNEK